jgi:hypothetical protein
MTVEVLRKTVGGLHRTELEGSRKELGHCIGVKEDCKKMLLVGSGTPVEQVVSRKEQVGCIEELEDYIQEQAGCVEEQEDHIEELEELHDVEEQVASIQEPGDYIRELKNRRKVELGLHILEVPVEHRKMVQLAGHRRMAQTAGHRKKEQLVQPKRHALRNALGLVAVLRRKVGHHVMKQPVELRKSEPIVADDRGGEPVDQKLELLLGHHRLRQHREYE